MSNINAPYNCRKCPRLADFLDEQRNRLPSYFNGPVPNFFSPDPKAVPLRGIGLVTYFMLQWTNTDLQRELIINTRRMD